MTSLLLFSDTVVVAVLLSAFLYLWSRTRAPLPPGPKRHWPLIGNVLDMPRAKAWLVYTQWKKQYGDIIFLSMFGNNVIVLNSAKAAFDLLHKRSNAYSDRPYLAMGGDLVGWDHGLSLTPYGKYFNLRRRLMRQVLGPRPAQAFWPSLELQCARFLNRLVETPEHFIKHIRHTAAANALKISHGYPVSETEADPLVAQVENTLEQFSMSTAPGAFLVDFLPWLKYIPSWFPGAEFRRTAAAWRKDLFDTADTVHQFTKDQMAKGIAVPSFSSKLLGVPHTPETEFAVKWTAFSIYGGGADTTVSAVSTFFLAMCTHPEAQMAAQAELDAVVGNGRLPGMADRPSLPYTDAIVREVLRWGPVVPGGVPHRLIQEDEYRGYRIPAGSTVISNIWGIAHDPDIFPDPHEFRPERFIGPEKVDDARGDPLQFAFGFGRRVCPGQHLAEPSLFLSVAMTLATFTISKARDKKSGKIIEPSIEWEPGTISHPKPFRCEITPRSDGAVGLIKQAIDRGQGEP